MRLDLPLPGSPSRTLTLPGRLAACALAALAAVLLGAPLVTAAEIDPRDPRAIAARLEKVPAFVERRVAGVVVERRGDAYVVTSARSWDEAAATWGSVVRHLDRAHWRAGYGIHGPTRLVFVTSDRLVTTPLHAAHDCRHDAELDDAERGACVLRASTWRER